MDGPQPPPKEPTASSSEEQRRLARSSSGDRLRDDLASGVRPSVAGRDRRSVAGPRKQPGTSSTVVYSNSGATNASNNLRPSGSRSSLASLSHSRSTSVDDIESVGDATEPTQNDDVSGGTRQVLELPIGPRRARSLVKRTRSRAKKYPIVPNGAADEDEEAIHSAGYGKGWWYYTANIVTCCIPSWCLSKLGKMHEHSVQQAWREKVTLCLIAVFLWGVLAFITFAFTLATCPGGGGTAYEHAKLTTQPQGQYAAVHGDLYNMASFYNQHSAIPQVQSTTSESLQNTKFLDASPLFPPLGDACTSIATKSFQVQCQVKDIPQAYCHNYDNAKSKLDSLYLGPVVYTWEEVIGSSTLFVYNGQVLDLSKYLADDNHYLGDEAHTFILRHMGRDGSRAYSDNKLAQGWIKCLEQMYRTGVVEKRTVGCVASDILLNLSFVVILAVVLIRFAFAVFFSWTMSHRLGSLKFRKRARAGFTSTTTENTNVVPSNRSSVASIHDTNHSSVDISNVHTPSVVTAASTPAARNALGVPAADLSRRIADASNIVDELYTVLMVPCYSENEDALRITLDSLSLTDYSDDKKLIVAIADGMITGSGNSKSTPQTLVDMMELDPSWPNPPEPVSYIAVADGSKRHNMAQLYVGHYRVKDRKVPTIAIVKCGTPEEKSAPKPGNRGKRDSQLILMHFFQRVIFDENMTPLDYDLFTKIKYLMGVTADEFEICLMVDADTKVASDSLPRMVACMARDPKVIGLCGETRISNKSASWVTRIQVFEYYINHHLNKAFESVFGGVTCLPGCFCMYRIKTPRDDGYWVPILASPDIVTPYSAYKVETLHEKNLLLLGEDRYLTTLMLRTFPKRKLIFVPRAYCKTEAPASFKVLLSQRRRWINSTIHNLFELVLVRELCGTFCFSMQFIILLELLGTFTLPAAITFTTYLIINTFVGPEVPWLSLALLAAILGLPAVLIAITTRKLVYVYWMAIYLCSLPVWNGVLPLYAFWHFDDFSWGQTRRVDGEAKGDHGKSDGSRDGSHAVPRKRWIEWEAERRQSMLTMVQVPASQLEATAAENASSKQDERKSVSSETTLDQNAYAVKDF